MQLLKHIQNADGSHDLIFQDDNAYAVDEFLKHLRAIYQLTPNDTAAFIYIDMSSVQMYSLRYLATELRNLLREQQSSAPLHIAIVINESLVDLTSSLLKTILRRDFVQYFVTPAKARLWLTMEKNKQNVPST